METDLDTAYAVIRKCGRRFDPVEYAHFMAKHTPELREHWIRIAALVRSIKGRLNR